jgi:hypothetical protein
MVQGLNFMKAEMNLRVSFKTQNFLTKWTTTSNTGRLCSIELVDVREVFILWHTI